MESLAYFKSIVLAVNAYLFYAFTFPFKMFGTGLIRFYKSNESLKKVVSRFVLVSKFSVGILLLFSSLLVLLILVFYRLKVWYIPYCVEHIINFDYKHTSDQDSNLKKYNLSYITNQQITLSMNKECGGMKYDECISIFAGNLYSVNLDLSLIDSIKYEIKNVNVALELTPLQNIECAEENSENADCIKRKSTTIFILKMIRLRSSIFSKNKFLHSLYKSAFRKYDLSIEYIPKLKLNPFVTYDLKLYLSQKLVVDSGYLKFKPHLTYRQTFLKYFWLFLAFILALFIFLGICLLIILKNQKQIIF